MMENRIYGGHKCCQCDGTPAPSYGGSLHCMPSYYLIDTNTELLAMSLVVKKKKGDARFWNLIRRAQNELCWFVTVSREDNIFSLWDTERQVKLNQIHLYSSISSRVTTKHFYGMLHIFTRSATEVWNTAVCGGSWIKGLLFSSKWIKTLRAGEHYWHYWNKRC